MVGHARPDESCLRLVPRPPRPQPARIGRSGLLGRELSGGGQPHYRRVADLGFLEDQDGVNGVHRAIHEGILDWALQGQPWNRVDAFSGAALRKESYQIAAVQRCILARRCWQCFRGPEDALPVPQILLSIPTRHIKFEKGKQAKGPGPGKVSFLGPFLLCHYLDWLGFARPLRRTILASDGAFAGLEERVVLRR